MEMRVWNQAKNKMVYTTIEAIAEEIGFEYGLDQNVLDFTEAVKAGAKPMIPIGIEDNTGTMIYTQDIVERFGCRFVVQKCKGGYEVKGLTGEYEGQSYTIDFIDNCKIVGDTASGEASTKEINRLEATRRLQRVEHIGSVGKGCSYVHYNVTVRGTEEPETVIVAVSGKNADERVETIKKYFGDNYCKCEPVGYNLDGGNINV